LGDALKNPNFQLSSRAIPNEMEGEYLRLGFLGMAFRPQSYSQSEILTTLRRHILSEDSLNRLVTEKENERRKIHKTLQSSASHRVPNQIRHVPFPGVAIPCLDLRWPVMGLSPFAELNELKTCMKQVNRRQGTVETI